MDDTMIKAEAATKIYYKGKPQEVTAISDVSLEIDKGEMVVLKGPSGSGKTTLLTLIGCLARPISGRITVAGKEVSRLQEPFLTLHRRIHVGFIFQQFHLLPKVSVYENVILPLYPIGVSPGDMSERAEAILSRLHIEGKKDYRVQDLSGGEQQRVAIARALINEPEIILADEPTANLDTHLSHRFLEIVKELKADGKTIVIASHDPLIYEYGPIDRVFDMRDGLLV